MKLTERNAFRRWLAATPELLSAYLVWANGGRRQKRRQMLAAIAPFVAWMAAVSLYVHRDRVAALSTLKWIQRHDLFWTIIATIMSAVLVSRRRTLNRITGFRSWTAALPVDRSAARWQAVAIESVPAVVMAGTLAAMFGGLSIVAVVDAGIPAPWLTWAAMTGGVVLGAGVSYLLPVTKQEEIYEGSRYVPHRRRAETPIPTGSLSALGTWPVRQLFANARPKTISRVMVLVLLSVPLGSTAADAMVAIGLLAAIGSLLLLVGATVSVSVKASRWLKPLPLGSGRLARKTLIPALASMLCGSLIESWLMWVLGSPVDRCIAIGIETLLACLLVAVAGSLFAIHADDAKRGR